VDRLFKDIRVGIRCLAKSPLITLPAILSLALGIAATTTIFSVTDIVLFQPLRFQEPERLMAVWATNAERGWSYQRFSLPDLLDYRERARTLDIAGYQSRGFNLSGTEQPERLSAVSATSNIFSVTGFEPIHGRAFTRDEETEGRHHVVVLGYDLWQRHFGGDPKAVGRTVKLDGVPYTVIGIMPPAIPYPFYQLDAWTPPGITWDENRSDRRWKAIARLSDGAPLDSARAELTAIAGGLEEEHPRVNAGMGARLNALREDVYGEGPRYGSIILLTAAVFVLLIACANVANLLLARAVQRQRELAVRTALGARRGQIVQQLLTESTLLGLGGGLLGVLISIWGIQALATIIPADPPLPPVGLDLRVLGFTAVVAVFAGIVVGTVPALRTSLSDLQTFLTAGARGSTSGARKRRAQDVLVVSQIALALMLLVCAGMLIRTVVELQRSGIGFNLENLLVFRINPPETKYPGDDSLRLMYAALKHELGALPGVSSVASVSAPPLTGPDTRETYGVEGEVYEKGKRPMSAVRWTDPDYFATLGVALVRGRGFSESDSEGAPAVIVVSEAFAERHWDTENPIGKRIETLGVTWEVIGVVQDLRYYGPGAQPTPIIYLPTSQSVRREMAVVVRADREPETLIRSIRAAVLLVDPDQPIFEVRTMRELLRTAFEGTRIVSDVSAVLGAVAMIMAVLGIYGVMAHTVAQRTHETGIRIALGATAHDIRQLMAKKGAAITCVGLLLGVLMSLGMMRIFYSIFHGFVGFDGLSLTAASVVLFSAALGASYVPAQRAARLDPTVALRSE
jgi:putative ABC transport system permease protein